MGVYAVGCDGTAVDAPVILEMGNDDPASGNTVSWMQSSNGMAVGAWLLDCVIRSSFQYNTFTDSSLGVVVIGEDIFFPPYERPHTSFKHNTFERLGFRGLSISVKRYFVDEISDNRFVDNTRPLNGAFTQSSRALYLDIRAEMGSIRRNQFIGNDVGVEIDLWSPQNGATDFGTSSAPGNNVFRCNSGVTDVGADVLISADTVDWTGTLHFAGNAWDHAPPTLQLANPPPNGTDIALPPDVPNITVDRANATLSTAVCPSGRVPGQ
jgi:hypothetical protein